jgi:hypothetical protein
LNEGGNLLAISRGVVVCITDWCVYSADVAVQMSLSKSSNSNTSEAWLQWIQDSGTNDSATEAMATTTPAAQVVLLISGSVQVLGGEGLGIVGVPYDVHTAVDVRRAFASIDDSKQVLQERLLSANTKKTVTNTNTDVDVTITTTTPAVAVDLPLGDVAALFGSNKAGEEFAAATVSTTTTAAVRKQPPHAAASAPTQLFAPNQSPNLDPATGTTTEDFNAMHELFSKVIEAGKAQQEAARAASMTTTGTAAMPTTTNTTGTSALPIPAVTFTDLAHTAVPEESPRKESANGPPLVQEVMSPDGGRNIHEDDDEDDDDEDDEQNMGISDMLISETQESATEQRDESQNESQEDDESEQGLETQQAAPMDTHEDLHAQSSNVAEISTASPGTATTAAAQANRNTSRKRRQYFDERIEWVNMDLVEQGIVAVPRTANTPMLTMEKLWRHMASKSGIPRKQPPSRAESTTSELGGDNIRAMFLGGND